MKKKKQYRRPRSRAVTALCRIGEFVLATGILLLLCGAALMQTVAAGPSESAKREAIAAVSGNGKPGFVAGLFYSDAEIEQYTVTAMPQAQS